MNELENLYQEYLSLGYNQNMAILKMRSAGYDKSAMTQMIDLYSKKKSQDGGASESSSETGSMGPTSAGAQPQQQGAGASDYQVDGSSLNLLEEDYRPINYNIPQVMLPGAPSTTLGDDYDFPEKAMEIANVSPGIAINAHGIVNGDGVQEFSRLFNALHIHHFQQWGLTQMSKVDPESIDEYGFMPIAADYIGFIENIARKQVLSEETQALVNQGMGLDEALKLSQDFQDEINAGYEDWKKRGGSRRRIAGKDIYKVFEIKKIEDRYKDVVSKLDQDYTKYLSERFLDSVTNEDYVQRDEDGNFTGSAVAKLNILEDSMRRRLGVKLDLTGEGKIGDRPFLKIKPKFVGDTPIFEFEGALADAAEAGGLTAANAAIWLFSRMSFSEGHAAGFEGMQVANEERMSELRGEIDFYQRNVLESIKNNDYASAIEQSFLMTAEGWPYLVPLMFSEYLGPYGSAALASFYGVVSEASAIRNDVTFDTFVLDGKEYSYYEAVDILSGGDPKKKITLSDLQGTFEIKENNLARAGYLTAVGIGDFGISYTSIKTLRGMYQRAQYAEARNFLTGYLSGLGIALPENALADMSAYVGREATRSSVTGDPYMDVDQLLEDGLNFALSKTGTSGLLYTLGSAQRRSTSTPSSRRRTVEVIPLNAKEINNLSREIRETQIRVSKSTSQRNRTESITYLNDLLRKRGILYRQNEQWLDYVRTNAKEDWDASINALNQLDRIKASWNLTNDPNLKMMYKERAKQYMDVLSEVYAKNKQGFYNSLGAGLGVKEREIAREIVGMTLEEAMGDGISPVQLRPMPANPVPLSPTTPEIKARWDADAARRQADDWMITSLKDAPSTTLNRGRLEEILRTEQWATLTAENPNNKGMGDLENQRMNRQAEEWLKREGLEYHEIKGRYDGKGENSFLVESMTAEQARRFAREFSQHSVATPDGLIKPDGSRNPYSSDWNFKGVKAGDDFLSAIKLEDGKVVGFSRDLSDEHFGPDGSTITGKQFWEGDESGTPPAKGEDDVPVNPEFSQKPWQRLHHAVKNGLNRIYNWALASDGGLKQRSVEEVYRSLDRLQSMNVALANDAKGDIAMMLKAAKNSPRGKDQGIQDIKDFLEGKVGLNYMSRFEYLSAEEKAVLNNMRERVDNMSESLINILESLPVKNDAERASRLQLIQTIRANKGSYLTRSYEIFQDGGKRLTELLKPREQMSKEVRKAFDDAVQYTATQIENPAMAEQMVRKYLLELEGLKKGGQLHALGAMNSPFFKSRNNNIPEPYAKLLGEIEDPAYSYMSTVAKVNSYLASARWQAEMSFALQESGIGRIGQEFEGTEGERGLYVRMAPNASEWEPLFHMYIPKEIQQAFQNLDPLRSYREMLGGTATGDIAAGALQLWTSATALGKLNATVMSPTSTLRNLWSGNFLQIQNGHFWMANPTQALDAMSMAWPTEKIKGKPGYLEERNKLISLGVLADGANSMEIMRTLDDFMMSDYKRALKGEKGLRNFARKFYSFGDDFYKVAGYYQERNKLISNGVLMEDAEIMAADRIRRGYPTYSYISKGAKAIRRFPARASFVSFPYEMYRTTKNNFVIIAEDLKAGRTDMAIERALGMITSMYMADGLHEYSKDVLGFDDQDDEAIRLMGPEWQKLSKLFYLGKEDGVPQFIDLSYTFPQEIILKPIRALLGGDPNSETFVDDVLSMWDEASAPFIDRDLTTGVFVDVMKNQDAEGRQIIMTAPGQSHWEAMSEDPEKAERMLQHVFNVVAPGAIRGNAVEFLRSADPVPEDHPLHSIQRHFNKFYPKETRYKIYTAEDALYGLLGFRVSGLPFEVSADSQLRDQVQFAAQTENYFFREVSTGAPISEEDVKKSANKFISEHKSVVNSINKIIRAGRKLEMSDHELRIILNEAGIPKMFIGQYMDGKDVLIKGISTEKLINRANQITDTSRLTEEEKQARRDNIQKAVAIWNAIIGEYNTSLNAGEQQQD